jgi:hypothetical protein
MGALVYPSTSGQGVGALTYSFAAVPGAEYNTTELNASSIYEFRAQEEPITVAIYAVGNLTTPIETISLVKGKAFTHNGTIARIRILTATSGGNTAGTGSTLLIIKYSSSIPARTGSSIDGLGEVYAHTEKSTDWFAYEGYGMNTSRNPMTARLDGTANTAAWVCWTYDSTGTGVYRFRNTPSAGQGIGTSSTTFSGIAGNFFYKALNNTTNTWTRLADIPLPPQSTENATTFVEQRLRRAVMWDTGADIIVWFRCNDNRTQTINSVVYTSVDTYLYTYTKATDTWTFIGAWNLGATGYNSYVDGPQMSFTHTISGVRYWYNWQQERSGNGFVRYNLSNGVRDTIQTATDTWHEGSYVNNYFLASPTQGIGNTDGGTTDYQIYDPTNNVWAKVTPPSRTNEASTWFRGGQIFRYSNTAFGVIGRRTYTTNATAPSNTDRYWGRRLYIYDTATQSLDRWLDKSEDMGDFYPLAMRPGNDTYGSTFIWQPADSSWNGRFWRFRNNYGGSALTRYNHDYVDTQKPKKVEYIGNYRPRGEMAVGLNTVFAFGYHRNPFAAPVTYAGYSDWNVDSEVIGGNSTGDTVSTSTRTRHSFETWGGEMITTAGEVYPVFQEITINQAIYDPQMRRYYVTGLMPSRLGVLWNDGNYNFATYNRNPWRAVSGILEEDTGRFWYQDQGFTGDQGGDSHDPTMWDRAGQTSGLQDPGELAIYAAGRAYKPGVHFMRPYDANQYEVYNIWNQFNRQYGRNYRWTNYTWYSSSYQGAGQVPQGYTLGHDAIDNRYVQVVKFGSGRLNAISIPEGTIFWDGRTLVQYSREQGVSPFTAAQTGWRRLHTTSSPYWTGDTTMLRAPHVWYDGRYAICEKPDGTGYYVFDMDNLASEPKIISSHIPMNSRSTPSYVGASSGTIGNNWSNFSYNKACLGGVEIIAGGSEADGVRTWRNTAYFLVRAKEV